MCICYNFSFRHPILKYTCYHNLINSNLRLLIFLKICWTDDVFVPTPSLWSLLLHASGQSKQMLTIVGLNALDIKGDIECLSLLECTPRQWRVKVQEGILIISRNAMVYLLHHLHGQIIHASNTRVWSLECCRSYQVELIQI